MSAPRVKLGVGGLLVALSGCASAPPPPPMPPPSASEDDPERASRIAVRADAGVSSGEAAWLVAHLADDPDPSHRGESDAVRRLVRLGAPGVRVVAEVFRHGEARRMPYARRVLERLALERCQRSRPRAIALVAWLQRGDAAGSVPLTEGFVWWGAEDVRWEPSAIERLLGWAEELPCRQPSPQGDAGSTTEDASLGAR